MAFDAFFRRVKSGQKAGYPRFRSADRWDTVEWPKDGDGCRWKPEHNQVYVQGIGTLKVTVHRPVEGVVKTISVKREGRRWFLVLSCHNVGVKLLPVTGAAVGIDMGVTVFLATCSENRHAAQNVVANRQRKVANQRRDFHHQLARRLICTYDVIAVEDLAVKNMSRSASGTLEAPGVNVAAKSGLNRSILDAGWAQFRQVLTDKAEEAGRQVIVVNPRYTSQTHWTYGLRGDRSGVSFWCPHCCVSEHADLNAARNILRAGLALPAAQAA